MAAVAAVRPALGDRALPAKRDTARPAVPAAHIELRLVDELGHGTNLQSPSVREAGSVAATDAGSPIDVEVGDRIVRLSSPERVYFPARGETKLDLARYYIAVCRRHRPGAA